MLEENKMGRMRGRGMEGRSRRREEEVRRWDWAEGESRIVGEDPLGHWKDMDFSLRWETMERSWSEE